MAEEIFSGYDAQSDTKCQKLLECILTGNSKLYLGKAYTENQLPKLNDEDVEKLFICMNVIKMEERVETMKAPQLEMMGPVSPGSYSNTKRELLCSIGLFIATGLLGFWFGVGVALGSKMVNSLEELISR